MNGSEIAITKLFAQLSAIDMVKLLFFLFVACRHISRIDNYISDPFSLQCLINPKPTKTSFVYAIVFSSRKILLDIVSQNSGVWWLDKRFMVLISRHDTHCPLFFMNVNTQIDRFSLKT